MGWMVTFLDFWHSFTETSDITLKEDDCLFLQSPKCRVRHDKVPDFSGICEILLPKLEFSKWYIFQVSNSPGNKTIIIFNQMVMSSKNCLP